MADDTDTAPATGRDFETNESKAFDPDKAWLDALQQQTTATLLDELRKYARRRARFVATSGYKVDKYFEREVVQDVVTDTWSGVLRWDPARCTLKNHLCKAIRTRTYKLRERQIKSPHIYIGDDTRSSRRAERDASAVVADPEHPMQRVFAREVLEQVRAAAAGDKEVLRILDAYQAGAQTRYDVLALAKMKERTYHNAHIRLMRIVQNAIDCTLAPKARV
jgi:hypothetical protein